MPTTATAHRTKRGTTRHRMIATAAEVLRERGATGVTIDEVLARSGAPRGSVYHHFPGGKKDLMEALYEAVEGEFTERVATQVLPQLAQGEVDPLDVMKGAIGATLDLSLDPEIQQILLVDSLSVLGWERWREIADGHSLAVVRSLLTASVEAGSMKPLPTDSMANLLMAALAGGALTLALLALRQLPLPAFALRWPWLARLHDHRTGVPYGIALAGAALAVYPQSELWTATLAP